MVDAVTPGEYMGILRLGGGMRGGNSKQQAVVIVDGDNVLNFDLTRIYHLTL